MYGNLENTFMTEQLRQPTGTARSRNKDVIAPEGYKRGLLDRSIEHVDWYFGQAFGFDRSPLPISVRRLRTVGAVALLDVGCGTGNTLRTWTEALRPHASGPEDISATGINLYDYSEQSKFPETREAIQRGEIEYLVGDAQSMPEIPEGSADVVTACMVLRVENPIAMLDEMVRVARPGGTVLLNVKGDHNISDSPIMERIWELEDAGCDAEVRVGYVPDPNGLANPWPTTFIRIEKPGILLPYGS
jgi:SAM-dependent methyltransferase